MITSFRLLKTQCRFFDYDMNNLPNETLALIFSNIHDLCDARSFLSVSKRTSTSNVHVWAVCKKMLRDVLSKCVDKIYVYWLLCHVNLGNNLALINERTKFRVIIEPRRHNIHVYYVYYVYMIRLQGDENELFDAYMWTRNTRSQKIDGLVDDLSGIVKLALDNDFEWFDSFADEKVCTSAELLELFIRGFHDDSFSPKFKMVKSEDVQDYPMRIFKEYDECGACSKIDIQANSFKPIECFDLIQRYGKHLL